VKERAGRARRRYGGATAEGTARRRGRGPPGGRHGLRGAGGTTGAGAE